jgi:hypothetical protein
VHKPIQILNIYDDCNEIDENGMTISYMSKHGIDNVRGGVYKNIKIDKKAMKTLETELKITHHHYKMIVLEVITLYIILLHVILALKWMKQVR